MKLKIFFKNEKEYSKYSYKWWKFYEKYKG